MKIEMKRNWNFIGIIRLIVGMAGTIQGFIMNEFALSLAGFLLVYMAVAGTRYFGVNNFELQLKKAKSILKETEHEKVDARL